MDGRRSLTMLAMVLILALLLLPSWSQTAQGQTVVTYTSTTDFDSGDKSMGDAHFASNGRDQPAYSQLTNPSAIYANGKTYMIWQSSPSWLPYITTYTHSTGAWATPVQVSNSIPVGQDGHGAPSVFVSSNGYIHVMYGSHASSQEYSRSTSPYDISSWTTMSDSASVATYPNLWEYGGNLHFFYRRTGLDDWTLKISTNNGDSWGPENVILSFSGGASTGAYFGGAYSQYQDRIYLSFVKVSGAGVRDNVYVFYIDLDNLHAFSVSGTDLGTTISEAEADASLLVRDTPFGASHTVVHVSSTGTPFLMYSNQIVSGSNPAVNVVFTRWTGSAWAADQIITTTDTGSNYFDFIVNSESDLEAFITGPGEDWLANADEYSGDMERWTWNGASWTFVSYVMRERESGKPVNHPEVPVNYQADLRLIFGEFGAIQASPHEYVGGMDNLKLYGWGNSNDFNYRHEVSSGNLGIETITDNARFGATNSVALTRFPDDSFATTDTDADTWKWNFKAWDGGGPSPVITFNQKEITGGALVINMSSTSPGGEAGVVSPFSYTSDFDYWASAEQIAAYGTSGSTTFSLTSLNLPLPRCELTGASVADGVQYRFVSPSNGFLQAFTCANGVLTQQGSNTVLADTTFCIRVKKVGWNWTTYYSTSLTCSPWVQDEDFDFNVTGGLYPSVAPGLVTGTNLGFHVKVYDVFVDTTASFFRSLGRWTTPTTSLSDQSITGVTIGHSSLSTTAYIDRIDVLVNSVVVWSYTTDTTSGTSTTVAPSMSNSNGLASIRVMLAGNGIGSPSLESVSFEYGTAPSNGGTPSTPGTGTPGGTIEATRISGYTFQFFIGSNVTQVVWNFGDGKTFTSGGGPVIHSYLSTGTYTVTANTTYSDGFTETLTIAVVVPTGPAILDYIVATAFIVGMLGALFLKGRQKLGFAFMGLITAAWMLYTFPETSYPFLTPKLLVQGSILLGGLAAVVYALLPGGDKKRPRGAWLILGLVMLLVYALTVGVF